LQKLDNNIVFFEKKNANFFRRKSAKIEENCDHNIDPWSRGIESTCLVIGREIGSFKGIGVAALILNNCLFASSTYANYCACLVAK
jgi:hypothetical protein